MGIGNGFVDPIRYIIIKIVYSTTVIALSYLMIITPWRPIIAAIIPTATAALAVFTDKIKPHDCEAAITIFLGYISSAIAYMIVIYITKLPLSYYYYAMFMATTLSWVAAAASIRC